jgi:predicted lipoprotein
MALIPATAATQTNWREVAVPMYGASAYARGEALFIDARARTFAAESSRLAAGVHGYCAGGAADSLNAPRMHWRATVTAWDAFAALSTGPLVERRSARSIDFWPVRPALLRRAIASSPATLEQMDAIGAPARGFAALEWLLWSEPANPHTPACAYAELVARDIEREAAALANATRERLAATPDEDEAAARLGETVNQWLGGIEQLRWAFMRKPLDVAATSDTTPVFPRSASGQTAATWAARWDTLRAAAVLGARSVPVPGEASVPFETLLRGRGLNPLADRLVETVAHVDRTFAGLTPAREDAVRDAAGALGELAQFTQDELAPALAVRLGFSDADGD